MDSIQIAATQRTPDVQFNFDANEFSITGESYPENVTDFYGSLMEALETHLESQEGAKVTFKFELVYINSSTAKIVMEIFDLLDQTGERGNEVTIIWRIEEEDDNMQELGEEFAEDLESVTFTIETFSG
ncbi:MAG: DUF1987 domain-containing protein [Rhodospirillaceae bacterium]